MSINNFLRRDLGPVASRVNLQVEDNVLNAYDRSAYHFRLIMVGERDANDVNIHQRLSVPTGRTIPNPDAPQASDPVRQIIVAQSGVTAGLNITSVEIQDSVSPNHRTQNTTTTELKIKISEPYGMQLVDQIYLASRELGLQNWRLAPMFLELTFKCYDAEGFVISDDNTVNIRKVWKIILVEFNATLTEVGTTYEITAATSNTQAFMDYYYLIPHSRRVNTVAGQPAQPQQPGTPPQVTFTIPVGGGGGTNTVGGFFDELGRQLTEFYIQQRESPLYLNNPVSPLMIYKFKFCDQLAILPLPQGDLVGQRRASFARVDNGNDITVSRGVSITALLDDVLASILIDADENTAWWVSEPPAQGGRIRIPKVECVITNVGWDEQLNDYIREFNFLVSLSLSTRPVPTRNWGVQLQSNPNYQEARFRRIVESGSLKKAYPYYYTGLNTEIIHLDLSFQNLHIIPLPYADTTPIAVLDQTRINEVRAQIQQLESQIQQLESEIAASRRGNPGLAVARRRALEAARQELAALNPGSPGAPARPQQLSSGLAFFDNASIPQGVTVDDVLQTTIRNQRQSDAQVNLQNINNRLFVEDVGTSFVSRVDRYTYAADIRDMANRMSRVTVHTGQERSRQLYSSILSQMYDRTGMQLTEIEMTIKGDPYWLGKTNLERGVELDGFLKGVLVPGTETARFTSSNENTRFANYYDTDAHFLLLFRSGQPPNIDTGFQDLNLGQATGNNTTGSVFFAASYQTIEVTHVFEAGKFTQKLKAIRDNLINLNGLRGENEPPAAPAEAPVAPPPPAAAPAPPQMTPFPVPSVREIARRFPSVERGLPGQNRVVGPPQGE